MCTRQRRPAEEDDGVAGKFGESDKQVTDEMVPLDLRVVRAEALGDGGTVLGQEHVDQFDASRASRRSAVALWCCA
ncbi:MAG: hypothetical protein U0V73_07610 [Acidimicrobiia bacterium]